MLLGPVASLRGLGEVGSDGVPVVCCYLSTLPAIPIPSGLTLPLGLPASRLERVALYIAGLEAFQARVPEAVPRHVAMVLLSLVALQLLKQDPSETAGHVKERFQLLSIAGALPAASPIAPAKTA